MNVNYGQVTNKASVPIRSMKLSNNKLALYLDG